MTTDGASQKARPAMKLIHILSQKDIDLLVANGFISEQIFMMFSHKEEGQNYYKVFFDVKEEWAAVYDFLHPDT